MLKRLASVVAVSAIVTGAAFGQGDDKLPGQGSYYLGGGARWTAINSNNSYDLGINLGYLFTKNIAGEATWGYSQDFAGAWQSTVGLKVKYLFFANSEFVPYLDAGGVYSKISGTDDTEYSLGGGFDYFVKPHTSIYVDVNAYKLNFDSDWTWNTTIGFRYWFK